MKKYKILTAFACVLMVFCLSACKENAKTDTSSGIDVSTHNSQSAENYSDIGENDVATETPDGIFNDSTQTDSTVFVDGTTQKNETNDTPDNADTTYESSSSEKEETHNSSEQSSSNEEIELPVDWFD